MRSIAQAAVLIGVLGVVSSMGAGKPCLRREYNKGIACMCNATYCDTIKSLHRIEHNKLYAYTTSEDGQRMDLAVHPFNTHASYSGFRFDVDNKQLHQKILGFGGAMTDAAGINIGMLSPVTRGRFLDSYFSPEGIEYSIIRVPIGGTDYSTRPYTYCDGAEDTDLNCFSLSSEDVEHKIPYIKEAYRLSHRQIRLLGATWYAPQWLLTKDFLGKSGIPPRFYETWANYHHRFLQEYEKHGLHFWAITTGNEPTFGPAGFVSWSSLKDVETFVSQHLGPMLARSPYKDISLLGCDDMTAYAIQWQGLLRSPSASKYLSGLATHWYMDTDMTIATAQDAFHTEFPDKILISTEAAICQFEEFYDLETSWERAERYASHIMEKLRHWDVGWVDWNIALDMAGGPNYQKNYCDAAVRVNATADEFYKQASFYILGHFSKFVPPGSQRVEVTYTPRRPLKAVAFEVNVPTTRTVVIILNRENKMHTVDVCKAKTNNCANLKVPQRSIVTAVFA